MIKAGCDPVCVNNLHPDDLDDIIQDRCGCLRFQSDVDATDFVASDWYNFELLDWLKDNDTIQEKVANSK